MSYAASFHHDASVTTADRKGQLAHRDAIAHSAHFERKLWSVRPGVWCLVGNGLSNQTFIEGPEGLIVIDTGECIQEMQAALDEIRKVCPAKIAAVIYTHFHYVAGTKALLSGPGLREDMSEPQSRSANPPSDGEPTTQTAGSKQMVSLPIWGHERIVANRLRISSEVSAAANRGMVFQFGIFLPEEGPDGLVNVGLGMSFRNPAFAPYTDGFIAPTHSFGDSPTSATIAGLKVEFTPAPSDSDDSVTLWFPELNLCVNNLVWPTLFNVFPIRGEEYRDPRGLLKGLDHILCLQAHFLVGAHGPPMMGQEKIALDVTEYRDSIQFMWDQTVRGINRGLTLGELGDFAKLPAMYSRNYLTRQYYGVVEHHVRQIHNGLRGWFDGDEAALFPLPPSERARRLIAGFGGIEKVREQVQQAIDQDELRWALELATWLIRHETNADGRADAGTQQDRALLATALRKIGQRTTAANIRNWCVTRALELDGLLDASRFRKHRFNQADVLANHPSDFVRSLRVLLVPERALGVNTHLRWEFTDGTHTGLHIRHHVAIPTNGSEASVAIKLELSVWASLLANKTSLTKAIADGALGLQGEPARVLQFFQCFDHQGLNQ